MVRLATVILVSALLLAAAAAAAAGCDKRIREADGSRHAPPLKTAEA
jgi:hypothetical protein